MPTPCFRSCRVTCGTAKYPLSFFTNARASETKRGEERRRTKVYAEAWNEKR